MRKSFIIIVIISVSTIVSLLLALYVAPLRTTFKQYSSQLTQQGLAKVGVSYSAIENARRNSVAGQYAVKGFDIPLISSKEKKTVSPRVYNNLVGFNSYTVYKVGTSYAVYRKYASFGSGTDVGLVYNTNAPSLDPANPNFGINQFTNRRLNSAGDLQSNEYITTTTDLSGANIASASTKQSANGGPPPQENDGPTPPTLPIGDGTLLLFAFSAVFTIFKLKKS